jgi:mannose-6-phosphate isomerase-like protein (cupin superfamily)
MIKNTETADHYTWGKHCDGWRLLDKDDLSVIQERVPPNSGEILHYHQRARQLFFVLQGQLQVTIGSEVFHLTVGDALEVTPAEPHQVHNVSGVDAIFLVISAPATRGDRTNIET